MWVFGRVPGWSWCGGGGGVGVGEGRFGLSDETKALIKKGSIIKDLCSSPFFKDPLHT